MSEEIEKKQNKESKLEQNKQEKTEKEKPVQQKIVKKTIHKEKKKDIAIVNGYSLRISLKSSKAVCRIIKGKSPREAIKILEEVIKGKKPVPMKNREVPHQKGKGISGARFPKKVCEELIILLKQAEANAQVNGLEDPIISLIKADKGPTVYRRGFRRAKRTHIYIELKENTKAK